MAKVITFSRNYPGYHPKAGQPTYFVEKFCKSINHNVFDEDRVFDARLSLNEFDPKHHTIRAGHKWKAGDFFSPRVWGNDINPKSGRSGPYNSKQIVIGPDTEIKKTWDFEIETHVMQNVNVGDTYVYLKINGNIQWCNASVPDSGVFEEIAKNDGLSLPDLKAWFRYPKPFSGQIICWNESIEY